jgi:hypothetical protein
MKKKSKANGAKTNGAKKSVPLKNRKAGRDAPVVRAKYTKKLPVHVADAEVAKDARELAKLVAKVRDVKDRRRTAMASFKEELNGYEQRQGELASGVDAHTSLRDVKCEERLVVETNEIHVVRLDTGEVVEKRTAEGADRQEALALDLAEAKADKANGHAKEVLDGHRNGDPEDDDEDDDVVTRDELVGEA